MQVKFNRKALALAIASTMGGFMAIDAHAVIDLNSVTGAVTFAQEMIVDDSNPAGGFLNNAGNLDLMAKLGFGVGTGSPSYIRIDLTNAKFGGSATFSGMVGADTLSTTPSQGGAGTNYLVYSYTPQTQPGQTATVQIGASQYKPTGTSSATATYRLYGTSVDAAQGNTNTLASASGNMWTFGPSYTFSSTLSGNAPVKIDVATGSMKFADPQGNPAGTLSTIIGALTLTENTGVYLAGGTPVAGGTTVDVVGTGTMIKVEGDFSAFLTSASKVYRSDSGCILQVTASTITATSAVFAIGDAVSSSYLSGDPMYICVETTGSVAMAGGKYTATYMPTAATGFTAANSAPKDMYTLVKNGRTFRVLLLPGATAADDFFIRIYNAGNNPATVRATVYDAAGATVGTANSVIVNALGANSYQVLDVTQLATAVGATGTGLVTGATRYWAKLEAESASVQVMLAVRVSNGTLVNMSSSVQQDN